jgi:hypothetical protein
MPTIEELQAELAATKSRIRELNDESKGHRLNAANARTEADAARADAERIVKETSDKVTAAEVRAADAATAAQARVINADLRLAAKDAGANDVADALALLPRDAIKLDDAGEITNAAGLKAAKPYLFGAPSTSSTAPAPKPTEARAKSAKDMTPAEYHAARTELMRRKA